MSIFAFLLLGFLQGVFEWLPVSSEGIVALTSQLINIEFKPIEMGLFLHLGTLLAVVCYFWPDWWKIIKGQNKKLLKFLILTTLISLIVGFPLYKLIEDVSIGLGLLLLTGLALLATSFLRKRQESLFANFAKIKKPILIVGLLQGLSIIPGFSRSGATIFGLSLSQDKKPQEILKISYLLAVPVGFLSNAYLLITNPRLGTSAWPALIVSFLVGLLALRVLFAWAKRINFAKFTFIFGLLCLFGTLIGFVLKL